MTRLSMPIKPANAAASAPIPNHNNTKPDVKISATMSIAPKMHHKTQNQSLMLTLREILQDEPDIRRPLGEPAHEVRIPVFSVRNIDSQVEPVACELSLEIAPHTIKHLKLVLLFPDTFTLREVDCRVDHLRIVRRD